MLKGEAIGELDLLKEGESSETEGFDYDDLEEHVSFNYEDDYYIQEERRLESWYYLNLKFKIMIQLVF